MQTERITKFNEREVKLNIMVLNDSSSQYYWKAFNG